MAGYGEFPLAPWRRVSKPGYKNKGPGTQCPNKCCNPVVPLGSFRIERLIRIPIVTIVVAIMVGLFRPRARPKAKERAKCGERLASTLILIFTLPVNPMRHCLTTFDPKSSKVTWSIRRLLNNLPLQGKLLQSLPICANR